MELTNLELSALNAKLPPCYSLEQLPRRDAISGALSQLKIGRSEGNETVPDNLPEKRRSRDKLPAHFKDFQLRAKQSEAYRKLYSVLQKIKKHRRKTINCR